MSIFTFPSGESDECHLQCEVFIKDKDTRKKIGVYRDIVVKARNTVQPGTQLVLKVSADVPCFVYIINIGSSGNITTLIPNAYDKINHLQSDQHLLFPSPKSGYDFELNETCGKETVVVLAYSECLKDVEQAKSDIADLVKKERDIRIVKRHSSLLCCHEIQFTVSKT